ncbi:MAG: hypothetical protein M1275_04060 [Patescibacteria group bacterium]|nr:hypothetical protein [Patescibacteria group bacterium]
MFIEFHQPIKAAHRLGMPRYVQIRIAATIGWLWLVWRGSDLVGRRSHIFDPVDMFWVDWSSGRVELGYWGWDRQCHFIASVGLSFAEAETRLKGVSAMFTTCAGRRIQLACGCEQYIRWLTQSVPFSSDPRESPKCETCGKYHQAAPNSTDVYVDCAEHASLLARWPDAREVVGTWSRQLTPSLASHLLYDALKKGPLDRGRQEELSKLISQSSRECDKHLHRSGLDPDLRDTLAMSVRRGYLAKSTLREYRKAAFDLSPRAVQHLERVVVVFSTLVWTVRCLAILAAVIIWARHLPDWRTVAVLAATAASVWVIVRAREWLK